MRCSKCSYISFDNVTSCSKCSSDLSKLAAELHGTAADISPFPFLNSILQSITEANDVEQEGLGAMLHVPETEDELHEIGDITDDMEAAGLADDGLEIITEKAGGEITLLAVDGDITLAEDDEITLRIDKEIALSINDLGKADSHTMGISAYEEEVSTEEAVVAPHDLENEAISAEDEEGEGAKGLTLDLEDIDLSDLEPTSVKAAITASEIAADLPESQLEIEGLESLQLEADEAAASPAPITKMAKETAEEIGELKLDFDEELVPVTPAPLKAKNETVKADSANKTPTPLDLSAMIEEGAKAADREEDPDEIMDLDLFHDDVEAEATTDALDDFDLPMKEGEDDLEIDLSLDDIDQFQDLDLDSDVTEPGESLQAPPTKSAELKLEMEKKDPTTDS